MFGIVWRFCFGWRINMYTTHFDPWLMTRHISAHILIQDNTEIIQGKGSKQSCTTHDSTRLHCLSGLAFGAPAPPTHWAPYDTVRQWIVSVCQWQDMTRFIVHICSHLLTMGVSHHYHSIHSALHETSNPVLLPIATMEAGSQELGVKVLSLFSISLLFHWQNFLPRLNYSTADYLCSATQYIQHTFMIIYDHHWSDILGHTRSINPFRERQQVSIIYSIMSAWGHHAAQGRLLPACPASLDQTWPSSPAGSQVATVNQWDSTSNLRCPRPLAEIALANQSLEGNWNA